jgi:uncharacterized protein YqjF (DUF2071 family)
MPGATKEILQSVARLKTRNSDVIIASWPKSGQCVFVPSGSEILVYRSGQCHLSRCTMLLVKDS